MKRKTKKLALKWFWRAYYIFLPSLSIYFSQTEPQPFATIHCLVTLATGMVYGFAIFSRLEKETIVMAEYPDDPKTLAENDAVLCRLERM